jgi:hypothetical protein
VPASARKGEGQKFLGVAGDGMVEVRELYQESDFAPQ